MMNFTPFSAFGKGLVSGGISKGTAKGGFEEEDRSRDWYCNKCGERNFVKRAECFKCKAPKPRDVDCSAPPRPTLPQSGTTLNGMVKSYNRKGFGFLMCFGIEHCQDIHYTRENLSPKLQTRDIPGQHVTFELHRSPDGKLAALNIRPIGEEPDSQPPPGKGKAAGKGAPGGGSFSAARPGREEEDRSRDWVCTFCGERNFVKRFECFKCHATRTTGFADAPGRAEAPEPRRAVSPHAGSRAWREIYAGGGGGGGGGGGSPSSSRGRGRKKKRRRKRSKSKSSSSSSSSGSRRKKKRRQSSSSGSRRKRSASSDTKSSDCKMEEPGKEGGVADAMAALKSSGSNPELDKAKSEALQELLRLRDVESKEVRNTEFRALLRKWHPDKNPDRVEVATAVFQFLQKGKPVLDAAK